MPRAKARAASPPVSLRDYQALAEFRYCLRKFLKFSEVAILRAGIQPQQYLLMLAIKGLPTGMSPNIRTLAERLQVEHHSVVELVNRAVASQLVMRASHSKDRRHVLVVLSPQGEKMMKNLARQHRDKLRAGASGLAKALATISSKAAGK